MKSIRLNNNIREAIANKIMAAYDQNNPEPEVADTRDADLKKALWEQYLEDIKPLHALVKTNPILRGHIKRHYYFNVTINGTYIEVYAPKDEDGQTAYFDRLVTDSSCYYTFDANNPPPAKIQAVLDSNAAKTKEMRKRKEVYKAWELARNAYLDSVQQVIQNVNTTGQLLTVWPEVETFLPTGTVDPSRIQLPSVNVASLNAAIGV